MRGLLTTDGHVHALESAAREPLRGVRSQHGTAATTPGPWARERLFSVHFEPVVVEPYPLGLAGVTLWNMVWLWWPSQKVIATA